MAATPFKGAVVTEEMNGKPGPSYAFSASDVAAAFVTFDDLPGTPSFFRLDRPLRIKDILLSAAGVDTKRLVVTRGTETTTKVLRDAAMVETLSVTAQSRCQGLYDKVLAPGIEYGFKQLA